MSEYVEYSEYEKDLKTARDLAIRDATPEELLQNPHVQGLLKEIKFQSIRHDSKCTITEDYENSCSCFASRAREALKKFEGGEK